MFKHLHRAVLAAALLVAGHASAASIDSVYTDIDSKTGCITVDGGGEDDGDWAALTCNGYMGYPVIIDYADARESVAYGFTAGGKRAWESFDGFNAAGAKVEWRLLHDGAKTIPFATIMRWSVSDAEDADKQTEVLVVSKVGQLADRDACVVGLVLATGKPDANEMARKIADEQAQSFACGDERTLVGEPLPSFSRQQLDQ